MPRALSRQQQRRLLGAGRKNSSSELWIRNPLIWTACLLVLTLIAYVSQDFNQVAHYQILDVAYLKGTAVASNENVANVAATAVPPAAGVTPVVTASKTASAAAPPVPASTNNEENERILTAWRSETETACHNMMSANQRQDTPAARDAKQALEEQAMSKFTFPQPTEALPANHEPYQYCRNVFIDLGTNIGDSIGYFVDNALDVCSPIWMETHTRTRLDANFPRPHLDVTTLEISHRGNGNNPLFGMLQKEMRKSMAIPSSFCVYGMEGNPAFTPRLQKLENFVLGTKPRPIQHLHIHTESVVTSVDGPTKLYLDKTSVEQNFWGSSILSSQQDAVKSAKELGNGQVFSADVQGISLSTLVKNTMLPFKESATPEEQKGGLLIIKMDVEGAEYQVLKEAAMSGVLCDYVKRGNRVVLIVEFHNMSITDAQERKREKAGSAEAQNELFKCGVEFGRLQAHWH